MKWWQRHRRLSILFVVVIAAAGLLLFLRGPLVAWFSGESAGTSQSSTVTVAAGTLRIAAAIEPNPPGQRDNVLRVSIRDSKNQPVSDAQVSVTYSMPAMGAMPEMRGEAVVTQGEDGAYAASFDLPMAGSWTLIVEAKTHRAAASARFGMTVGGEGLTAKPASAEGPQPSSGGPAQDIDHYTCAMHPSVKQSHPGACPICGMELVPVFKHEMESGSITVSQEARRQIGVKVTAVKLHKMVLPIRAVGEVKYDETALHDVNLRMSGWVDHLRVNKTGQKVRRGQVLFSLYSPELLAAQIDYLNAARAAKRVSEIGHSLHKTSESLALAARRRLQLLGMTKAQLDHLERRQRAWENVPILAPASGYIIEKNVVAGDQVKAGERVFRIANLDHVWVEAQVYESDLPYVRTGQKVEVTLPYGPNTYDGSVDYIYPYLQGSTRTGTVRIKLPNPTLVLRPKMYANLLFQVDLGERLAVPQSAVIYAGPRRIVFVDLGGGKLSPHVVTIGAKAGDYVEVLSGLKKGDAVVTSGNFLIASESRLKSASGLWEGGSDDGGQ